MLENRMTISRKIKLFPVGNKEEINRVYKFIRDGQYAQYQASNLLMGQLMSEFYKYNRNIDNEEFKTKKKEICKNSNPIFNDIKFAIGVDTVSLVIRKIKQDFIFSLNNGLGKGERSIINYKRTNPLFTRGRNIKFYYEYEHYDEFLNKLYDADLKVYIKWVNKIVFKVIFGNPHRSYELRNIVKNIFEGKYLIQSSSIEIDDNKIILNLSLSIPKQKLELDEKVVVGVDLGLAIPAVCGLNCNDYIRKSIGYKDDFLKIRTQLQVQRRKLQKLLSGTPGGHGRKKKLKGLNKLANRERNFVKTYNHYVSKNVVDFAVKNKAKYINIEDLSGFDSSQFILRNWSFYELQQFITYKAAKYGIEVRKINPYHTSQICSCCGHWEDGQRIDQAHFKCKSCGTELNADFNASRNIAMSTDFVK